MKIWLKTIIGIIFLYGAIGCHSTKQLQTAVNRKDTEIVNTIVKSVDSLRFNINAAHVILNTLNKNRIDFTTFSAKAKVQYEDKNGKQPDFNAFIRIQKDSLIWVSISSTFLGIEAFRIKITPDTLIVLNKLDKTIEYHPFSHIEKVAHIPLNFSLLQNILIGNPIYVGDSIVSFRQTETHVMIGTTGQFFKNLLTLSNDNYQLERIKLDDIHLNQNRTAGLFYDNYEKNSSLNFSTNRSISVSEKTKVDIKIQFKQFEFNKDLSFPFNIPRNYKTK
ncbi:MAG: DUF4292 domain-containing protein [Ginsengibacter sp.]